MCRYLGSDTPLHTTAQGLPRRAQACGPGPGAARTRHGRAVGSRHAAVQHSSKAGSVDGGHVVGLQLHAVRKRGRGGVDVEAGAGRAGGGRQVDRGAVDHGQRHVDVGARGADARARETWWAGVGSAARLGVPAIDPHRDGREVERQWGRRSQVRRSDDQPACVWQHSTARFVGGRSWQGRRAQQLHMQAASAHCKPGAHTWAEAADDKLVAPVVVVLRTAMSPFQYDGMVNSVHENVNVSTCQAKHW